VVAALVTFDIFFACLLLLLLQVSFLLFVLLLLRPLIHKIDEGRDGSLSSLSLRPATSSSSITVAIVVAAIHCVMTTTLDFYGIAIGRIPLFLLGTQFKLSARHW